MVELSDIVVAILPIYPVGTVHSQAKTVPEHAIQMIELYCHLGLCLKLIADRFK